MEKKKPYNSVGRAASTVYQCFEGKHTAPVKKKKIKVEGKEHKTKQKPLPLAEGKSLIGGLMSPGWGGGGVRKITEKNCIKLLIKKICKP